MALKEPAPSDLGDEITDAEQEYEEDAEGEEGQERQERGSWEGSYIVQFDIDRLRRTRRIPEGVETRVPPDGEIHSNPEEGEYVIFATHFDRGFGLPLSAFSVRFFGQFLLQLHHLPANAITSMSANITFCDAYVGIRPLIKPWAKYFYFTRQVVSDPDNPDPKTKEMV